MSYRRSRLGRAGGVSRRRAAASQTYETLGRIVISPPAGAAPARGRRRRRLPADRAPLIPSNGPDRVAGRHSGPAATATDTVVSASQRPWLARPAVLAWVVMVALAVTALTISASAGAHPQNDDWSYVKSAFELRHGHLHLQGWGQMFLLGQLFTAQPLLWLLPSSTLTLDLYGALAMVGFLACVFALGRRCVGERRAVLLVLSLAVWPGMGVLTSSFMTDAPAAAGSLLALLLGVRAIERQSRRWLLASMGAGLFAFTVREQLVVAVVAVAIGALVQRGVSRRFRIDAMVAVAAIVVVGTILEHVRHQLPNADTAPFGLATVDLGRYPASLVPCLFTIALCVSPAAIWTVTTLRRPDLAAPGRVLGWVVGVLAVGQAVSWNLDRLPRVTLGNYVSTRGAFPVAVVGQAPTIMSTAALQVMQYVALISGIVIVGEVGAWLASRRRLVAELRVNPAACLMTAYTLLLTVFVIGLSFAGEVQFDRYLLPLFPGFGLILLQHGPAGSPSATAAPTVRPRVRSAAVVALVAFLGIISLDTMVSTDARDAAVWRAAERLVRQGAAPDAINAGLNWDGIHATTGTDRPDAAYIISEYLGQHWRLIFPRSTDCWVVTFSRLNPLDWRLLDTSHASPYGFFSGRAAVYSYRRVSCVPVGPP